MKEFISKFAGKLLAIFVLAALTAPLDRAQVQGIATRVRTVPDGLTFFVDDQYSRTAFSAMWPAGSKHALLASPVAQSNPQIPGFQYVFQTWQANSQPIPGNPIVVTADPYITEYLAVFTVQYDLSIRYFSCSDALSCQQSPGVVTMNGVPVSSDQDFYIAAGNAVVLTATPSRGYVFAGWQLPSGLAALGTQYSFTMNGPVTVVPRFQPARTINFATDPPGLQVLADRAAIPTPNTLEWGFGSTHTVGPVTPQQDSQGRFWSFESWSDGGAPTHSVQVPDTLQPVTFTATYAPSVNVTLLTSPQGLKLKVDGRDNWPTYVFAWGTGETHHLEAETQQTDAQGRIWTFAEWSNGGAAAQDLVVPASAIDVGVRLTATYNPMGRLTVTSSPLSATVTVDGADCAVPCDIQRPIGTQVRVAAPASIPLGDGSRADFNGWTGSTAAPSSDWTAVLGADPLAITANYQMMNRLAASSDPPEGASWRMQPSSPDGFYDSRATVNVNVAALPGYRFRAWGGDLSGSTPSGMVSMSAPRAVRATMDRVPYIAPAGVSNAAGFTPLAAVAPGSAIAIFGVNLAPATLLGPDNPLAQSLATTTVHLGDRLLPLFFVSGSQINAELPADLPEGQRTLVVSAIGQADVGADFTIARNAPGLFQQVVNGDSFAVALHEDGSAVTTDSPALTRELLTLYGTGFGPTDHLRPEGFAVPQTPPYLLLDRASVLVGDATLDVESAFAVPGRVGVDAVRFRLPDGIPGGANASLHVTINTQDSNAVLLPVK